MVTFEPRPTRSDAEGCGAVLAELRAGREQDRPMTAAYIIVSVEDEPYGVTVTLDRAALPAAFRRNEKWSQEAEDQLVKYLKRSDAWLIDKMKSNVFGDGLRLLRIGRSPYLIIKQIDDGSPAEKPRRSR